MSRGRVLLAAPRSFCAGVDRAIEIVERLLEQYGAPVYVRHQIVHNEHVVRRLEQLGAVFVEDEEEIPEGEICVLSAHGVAPAVKENAQRRGLRVVDALEDHLGTLRRPHADDICYATQNRQDAVKAMVAKGATLVLVIGSETSSNAQRLVEVAQAAGAQATLVDGESELDPTLLDGHETIGLTAGASTPEELVRATAARLADVGYALPEEIEVAKEDVHFRLPKEVAQA